MEFIKIKSGDEDEEGIMLYSGASKYSKTIHDLLNEFFKYDDNKEEGHCNTIVLGGLDHELLSKCIKWLNYYYEIQTGKPGKDDIEKVLYGISKKEGYTTILSSDEKIKIKENIIKLYSLANYLSINTLAEKLNEDAKLLLSVGLDKKKKKKIILK